MMGHACRQQNLLYGRKLPVFCPLVDCQIFSCIGIVVVVHVTVVVVVILIETDPMPVLQSLAYVADMDLECVNRPTQYPNLANLDVY